MMLEKEAVPGSETDAEDGPGRGCVDRKTFLRGMLALPLLLTPGKEPPGEREIETVQKELATGAVQRGDEVVPGERVRFGRPCVRRARRGEKAMGRVLVTDHCMLGRVAYVGYYPGCHTNERVSRSTGTPSTREHGRRRDTE